MAIALSFELSSHFQREIWKGVQEYGIGGKEWALFCRPHLKSIQEWPFNGVIAHLSDRKQAKELLALGLPLVDTASSLSDIPLPRVIVDEKALTQMAFDDLKSRGHRNYSYFVDSQISSPRERSQHFESIVRKSGFNYFPPPVRQSRDTLSHKFHPEVLAWLKKLPKPIAIFVCTDFVSAWLCDLCHLAQLRVPEDVALLGVGNEEIFCLGNYPNLSSLDLPGRKIGYESAKLLDSLMNGKPRKPSVPLLKRLPPVTIVTRHSTDTFALEDPIIASTVRYIREHISEPFTVGDIVRAVGVSRRLLEIRCYRSTQMTLLEQTHRLRIDRAKTLLASTTMKVADIAAASGFSSSFSLRRIFAKYAGTTPSLYRAKVQVSG